MFTVSWKWCCSAGLGYVGKDDVATVAISRVGFSYDTTSISSSVTKRRELALSFGGLTMVFVSISVRVYCSFIYIYIYINEGAKYKYMERTHRYMNRIIYKKRWSLNLNFTRAIKRNLLLIINIKKLLYRIQEKKKIHIIIRSFNIAQLSHANDSLTRLITIKACTLGPAHLTRRDHLIMALKIYSNSSPFPLAKLRPSPFPPFSPSQGKIKLGGEFIIRCLPLPLTLSSLPGAKNS